MDQIMVSVSMIAYNHEKFIQKAIEGVLMQKTIFIYELLIHDDASTDKTADIIRSYTKRHPDILKPIYQKENQYSKKVKIGINYNYPRAKGKYIALCEGDDYWTDPFKLQKQVEYLENNSECPMCFHAADKVDADNKIIGEIKPFLHHSKFNVEDIMCRKITCPTASITFQKKLIDKIPDFMYRCRVGDFPLELHLASKGDVYYMPDKMSAYRSGHSGSWTNRTFGMPDSRDKAYHHFKSLINMLDGFNEYTCYKYDDSVNSEKQRLEFKAALSMKDRKQLKRRLLNGKYKKQMSKLNRYARLKVYIMVLFPLLHLILYRIKITLGKAS